MQALTRCAALNGMLERTNTDGNKVIVDSFMIKEAESGVQGDVGRNDSSDEEDLQSVLQHIQTF